eukprot:TRINITY_DN58378_c0_g1_i1.p1 TRINITY_DN58378_c0_g1~~TRINITY_DN58378_c0_g1_i1.p1  ORF type:complete len:382 (+),score=26.41 TRINITY_DN58378_c0_g1_i1:22-1146(+)
METTRCSGNNNQLCVFSAEGVCRRCGRTEPLSTTPKTSRICAGQKNLRPCAFRSGVCKMCGRLQDGTYGTDQPPRYFLYDEPALRPTSPRRREGEALSTKEAMLQEHRNTSTSPPKTAAVPRDPPPRKDLSDRPLSADVQSGVDISDIFSPPETDDTRYYATVQDLEGHRKNITKEMPRSLPGTKKMFDHSLHVVFELTNGAAYSRQQTLEEYTRLMEFLRAREKEWNQNSRLIQRLQEELLSRDMKIEQQQREIYQLRENLRTQGLAHPNLNIETTSTTSTSSTKPSSLSALPDSMAVSSDHIKRIFDSYDVHGRGWLPVEDVKAIYVSQECFGIQDTEEDIDHLMQKVTRSSHPEQLSFDQFACVWLHLVRR